LAKNSFLGTKSLQKQAKSDSLGDNACTYKEHWIDNSRKTNSKKDKKENIYKRAREKTFLKKKFYT